MAFLASLAAVALATSGADVPPATSPLPELQEAEKPEFPQWSGALSLGASWTAGNTETSTVNGTFNAERRGEKDRWTYDAFANYGRTKDQATGVRNTTTQNYGASAKYDYFASDRLYYLGKASGKIDHVATLDLQTIVGAGVGYQWKETEKIKWGTEVGLSYVDERYEDSDSDADFLAARLASNLKYEISKSAAFEQTAEYLPSLEDSEDVIAKIDNRLKLNITGKWIAQIQYVLDFDGSVPGGADPGPDGQKETDHRVVLSIGWSFDA